MAAIDQQSELQQRKPVWSALSELFLDTELHENDHARIAAVLARSPYSLEKLDEILRFEVTPVLQWNLMIVTGEWAGFDEDWLEKKITPRLNKRPFLRFGVWGVVHGDWNVIKSKVEKLRLAQCQPK